VRILETDVFDERIQIPLVPQVFHGVDALFDESGRVLNEPGVVEKFAHRARRHGGDAEAACAGTKTKTKTSQRERGAKTIDARAVIISSNGIEGD